jgi:hypothetical protein
MGGAVACARGKGKQPAEALCAERESSQLRRRRRVSQGVWRLQLRRWPAQHQTVIVAVTMAVLWV